MATYTLTGRGTQAIAASGSLKVTITDMPAGVGIGAAEPENYYGLGSIRVGTAHGWLLPVALHAEEQLVPLPNGASIIGYALVDGVEITVEERVESPYAGP